MTQLYGPVDRWAWSLDSATLDVQIAYDGGTYTAASTQVERAVGLMADTNGLPGTWLSVWRTLAANLNTVVPNGSFEFEWQTPAGSTVTNSGILLRDTSGTPQAWSMYLQSPLTRRAFGTENVTINADADGEWASPYSSGIVWQAHTIHSQAAADKKDRDEERYIAGGGDDVRYVPEIEYGDPLETRRFDYNLIPAAHVEQGLAEQASFAQVAGLPQGDTFNQYYDLWDVLSRRREVLVQHGEEGQVTSASPLEWGYLDDQESRKMYRNDLNRADQDMRHYNLEVTLAIEGASGV